MNAAPSAPNELAPAALRALAGRALRIDRLECAAEAFAPLATGDDPFAALRSAVLVRLAAEEAALADALAAWLEADPEHVHLLTLAAFLPWRGWAGGWQDGVPHWVRVLAVHADLAAETAAAGRGGIW